MNNIWHRMAVILQRYGIGNAKVSPNGRSSDCSGRSFLKPGSSSSALPGVTRSCFDLIEENGTGFDSLDVRVPCRGAIALHSLR